jgi:hypothetical protein
MPPKKPDPRGARKHRPTPPKGVNARADPPHETAAGPRQPRTEPSQSTVPNRDATADVGDDRHSTPRETPGSATWPYDPSRRAVNAATDAALRASRRATRATPIIVRKAASILEEEVAMGIGAAKRIEQRFLDVNALRAQPSDAVMSRFRNDAHEAVDIILDIVTAAVITVEERAGRFINVTASRTSRAVGDSHPPWTRDETGMRLSAVRIPRVAPGAVGELKISLENESDESTTQFTLHAAELVSASGARIPRELVTFDPATLSVGPRSTGDVAVSVSVPEGTPHGVYEGLVRATQLDTLRALLSIEVG